MAATMSEQEQAMIADLELLMALDVLEQEDHWELAKEIGEDTSNLLMFEQWSEKDENVDDEP